ncbi:hypothetical protein CQW23_07859 [Capsicum baccatum]|uniref:Uncharacterized protein n=1 Tax=Capsicum baccatum TaxID=33114 RepID=A0A2G2X7D7_CAPBA|nr:hypothetical protein CQW23_07859 [Capsicum baccatum]
MEQVEGPEDNVVKVGTSISGDSVEPGHSQPLNLAGRSPRVVFFPDCPLLPHLHQLLVVLQQVHVILLAGVREGGHGLRHGTSLGRGEGLMGLAMVIHYKLGKYRNQPTTN